MSARVLKRLNGIHLKVACTFEQPWLKLNAVKCMAHPSRIHPSIGDGFQMYVSKKDGKLQEPVHTSQ